MISNIANLAINVAKKRSCSMRIYNGIVEVNIGEGNDRQTFICLAHDENRMGELSKIINLEVER